MTGLGYGERVERGAWKRPGGCLVTSFLPLSRRLQGPTGEEQVILKLPQLADDLISYRWPLALDAEYVRHSDECYTVTLWDHDGKHYTFRLNLSLDGRWTVAPIAGFEDDTLTAPQLTGDGWRTSQS